MAVCESSAYIAPSLFVNHGGGPYPILGEEYNKPIADNLKNVSQIVDLKRIIAIIVVTAHWEENVVTISNGKHHDLLYDYYNFPPESYKFKYDAPGEPDIARKIFEAFKSNGVIAKLDQNRGWDHGVFIPMMLINPEANIPVVQVSITKNQNSEEHYQIGKILYRFRKEGIAIIGSGMSYHNMLEFNKAELAKEIDEVVVNEQFDRFLNDICTADPEKRMEIVHWQRENGALEAHPLGEADHLMPLIVNAGAGGSHAGRNVFENTFMKKFKLSGFIWDKE